METCLIHDHPDCSSAATFFFLSEALFCPVQPIQLALTCKPLITHYCLYQLSFIYYWKINLCLWSASDANHFVSFFKFSFSSIVLCSSVLWWVLQKHPDICISIAPPDFSLKLFLAVMPTGYLWCAKSSVHLADKTVSLYILSIIYILSLSSS